MSKFQINVISHLLLIKRFSRFLLPGRRTVLARHEDGSTSQRDLALSATDMCGGWYSYRASKAALNQVIKTFESLPATPDEQEPSHCVGLHPGTVKTDLSKDFGALTNVVAGLTVAQSSKI